MSDKSFYLTTPIYYVNDAPHIGHAYTTVAGDLLTRWHRQRGESVWYLTGTDEHGQKVMRSAQANGADPQDWCDRLVETAWKPVWRYLEIANDDFIRTTEARHMERVQRFMQSLMEKGFIYEGKYEGPYCVGCEEFKLPGDLDDGKCKIHSKPIEMVSETNWFFKLSDFVKPLIEHYKNNPSACEPESARNEVVSFLEGGVSDLSISRSTFDWGIPVPWDTKQVIYVWFDALLNYATAVGLTDAPESEGGKFFAKTWPADVHLVGKDILRFHAVIWPAMLMAAGLPVPRKVFAHGWLLVGGEKMSKSKGNLVFVSSLIKEGIDPMAIRVALLNRHYRSDLMWSDSILIAAQNFLLRLRENLARQEVAPTGSLILTLATSLSEDLNTPQVFKEIEDWCTATESGVTGGNPGELARVLDALLGIAL